VGITNSYGLEFLALGMASAKYLTSLDPTPVLADFLHSRLSRRIRLELTTSKLGDIQIVLDLLRSRAPGATPAVSG
jgi:hypothetical protein